MDFPPLVNPDYLVPFPTPLSGSIIFVLFSWFLLLYQICSYENIFDLGASAGACDFREWIQFGPDPYISSKVSVQAFLFTMVFTYLCCCNAHRNFFFCFY